MTYRFSKVRRRHQDTHGHAIGPTANHQPPVRQLRPPVPVHQWEPAPTPGEALNCRFKVRYANRLEAELTLARLLQESPASAAGLEAYYCRHCYGYHLGHAR